MPSLGIVRDRFCLFVLACWLMAVHSALAQTSFSIFSDQLDNGFQNWSWGTNNNFANTSPVHSGKDSIAFASEPWAAISFWHSDFNPGGYTNLTFWANGGPTGGQIVQIYVQYNNVSLTGPAYQLPKFPTNAWRQFTVPLGALGMSGITNIDRISFQITTSGSTAPFYLDDVSLNAVQPSVVHLQIDATNSLRTVDSRWFGLNTAIWDSYF